MNFIFVRNVLPVFPLVCFSRFGFTFCPTGALKYLMLNPSGVFAPIVEAVKAVILAGGTLSPKTEVQARLLPQVTTSRTVVDFSCGHVVPLQNVSAMIVPSGPTGVTFDLRFQSRASIAVVRKIPKTTTSFAELLTLNPFFPSTMGTDPSTDHLATGFGRLSGVCLFSVATRRCRSTSLDARLSI